MFLVGIFGVNSLNKKIADVNFKCPSCTKDKAELIETGRTFALFFIPIYTWRKKFYVSCDNCKSIYKVKNKNIHEIIETKKLSYEDIESIILENNSCNSCNSRLEKDYKFCPYCGAKQDEEKTD